MRSILLQFVMLILVQSNMAQAQSGCSEHCYFDLIDPAGDQPCACIASGASFLEATGEADAALKLFSLPLDPNFPGAFISSALFQLSIGEHSDLGIPRSLIPLLTRAPWLLKEPKLQTYLKSHIQDVPLCFRDFSRAEVYFFTASIFKLAGLCIQQRYLQALQRSEEHQASPGQTEAVNLAFMLSCAEKVRQKPLIIDQCCNNCKECMEIRGAILKRALLRERLTRLTLQKS